MLVYVALVLFIEVKKNYCYFVNGQSRMPLLEMTSDYKDINSILPLLNLLPKPKSSEIKVEFLLSQLGSDYDSNFMSIGEPVIARDPSVIVRQNIKNALIMKTVPKMTDELKNLKIELPRSNGEKRLAGTKFVTKLQQWLYDLSKCPVRYKWVDMGENIFPRFVKRGVCSKKKTCSFPSGMKCNPSKWKSIKLLIYACFKNYSQNNRTSSSCKWRSMDIDVLTECSCGCPK